jgi:GAF domain-containing protein
VTVLKELRLQLDRLAAKRAASFDTDRSARANRLLKYYTKIVSKVVDAERCSVFINDPQHDKIWLKAGTGLAEHDIEVPAEGSIVGRVIQSGEPLIQSGLDKLEGAHKATEVKTGFVTRNVLCVPITRPEHQETIGAIQVLNKQNNVEFDTEDLEIVKEIADHLRTEVSAVFLDQKIFGLSETIFNTARRTIGVLLGGIAVALIFLFIVILVYVVLPAISS